MVLIGQTGILIDPRVCSFDFDLSAKLFIVLLGKRGTIGDLLRPFYNTLFVYECRRNQARGRFIGYTSDFW